MTSTPTPPVAPTEEERVKIALEDQRHKQDVHDGGGECDCSVCLALPYAAVVAENVRLKADCRNHVDQLGKAGLEKERLTALLAEAEPLLVQARGRAMMQMRDQAGHFTMHLKAEASKVLMQEIDDLLTRIGSGGVG